MTYPPIYRNNLAIDKGLDFAVRQIVQAKNLASLKDIRRQLNISERTFERRFSDHVGVAPKLFARICQFRVHQELQGIYGIYTFQLFRVVAAFLAACRFCSIFWV